MVKSLVERELLNPKNPDAERLANLEVPNWAEQVIEVEEEDENELTEKKSIQALLPNLRCVERRHYVTASLPLQRKEDGAEREGEMPDGKRSLQAWLKTSCIGAEYS